MTDTIAFSVSTITEDEARRLDEGAAWFALHPTAWDTTIPADYDPFQELVDAGADAYLDFAAACERTVAPGRCTGCEKPAAELIPWSGERLCWSCTDLQLDLLAKAVSGDVMVTR